MSRNDYSDYGTTPPLNICSIQNFRYPPYSTTASKISACKKHFLHFCSVILCTAWHPRDNFWFLLPCHRKKKRTVSTDGAHATGINAELTQTLSC